MKEVAIEDVISLRTGGKLEPPCTSKSELFGVVLHGTSVDCDTRAVLCSECSHGKCFLQDSTLQILDGTIVMQDDCFLFVRHPLVLLVHHNMPWDDIKLNGVSHLVPWKN